MAAFRKLWSTKHKLRILAIFLGVGLIYLLPFMAMPGFAAIFLQLDGIDGESTEVNHPKWIEVDSIDWKTTRAVSYSGPSPTASAPNISAITLSKRMDKSTPLIFRESVVGKVKNGKIHITRLNGVGESVTYYELNLYNILVSGFAQSSDGDFTSEEVSLNFSKIEMKYTPMDAKGGTGTPIIVSYDILIGK